MFNYIKSEEIEKAQLELSQFTDDIKSSGEDFMLYGFAKCLLLCNENTKDNEPYKALEIYAETIKFEFEQSVFKEFLNKYSLSIDIIKIILIAIEDNIFHKTKL